MEEPRKRFAGMMSGLDIHYDLGEGHPLLGRRMPDLDLVTDGPTVRCGYSPCCTMPGRCYSTSVSLAASTSLHGQTEFMSVDAKYAGTWELPVLGQVAAPTAVLIRPDGYVAWVGEGGTGQIPDCATR